MTGGSQSRFSKAWSLDPESYVSPAWWQIERSRLFGNQWIAVARANDLKEPGSFATFDVGGEPVVVVRNADGKRFSAFANICRHRGIAMLEGKGRASRIVCPYHRWTYGLDGKLIGAPLMEGAAAFHKEDCALHRFAAEEWQGFVFVHLGQEPKPLAPQASALAAKLPPDLAEWVTAEVLHYELDANWKIVVENFTESYHHLGVHEATLQPFWPSAQIRNIETDGRYAEVRHPVDPSLGTFTVYTMFPTMMMALLEPEPMCTWFALQVPDERRSIVDIHVILPAERAADPDAVAQARDTLASIQAEDTAIILKAQRGAQSRFAKPGPLSPFEGSLGLFHAWLARELGGAGAHV